MLAPITFPKERAEILWMPEVRPTKISGKEVEIATKTKDKRKGLQ